MFYFLNNLYIRIILGSFLAMFATRGNSQSVIDSQNIQVTFNKTSSIVFPAVITSVDRGSRDVLAQKAKGVNNVLQLKAAKPNFKETNLTVITGDGNLHHFTVRYSQNPSCLTVNANQPGNENNSTPPLLFETELTESDMQSLAKKIIRTSKLVSLKSTSRNDMLLSLRGIYISQSTMFCHLEISNNSNIPYTTDMFRLFIQDRKKVKRTAVQEINLVPFYVYHDPKSIPGKSTSEAVYAFPKFTIPDAKRLFIEMTENNGGRNLKLSIRNRTIINAKAID